MKRIAILMTCYNRAETTLRCLGSVESQKLPDGFRVKIFLVDDNSPDQTGNKVKEKFPEVHTISGSGNLYWSKGMALAWKTAATAGGFDFYLWLNDDVVLRDSAIAIALNDLMTIGDASVMVGACQDEHGNVSYGCLKRCGGCIQPTGHPVQHSGDFHGNFVLIPKTVFEKIGGMAECYWHAFGDFDYAARLRKHGIQYYLASHVVGTCTKDGADYGVNSPSLLRRLKDLFLPKGRNLHDVFLYRSRNYGFFRALVSCAHVVWIVVRGRRDDKKTA